MNLEEMKPGDLVQSKSFERWYVMSNDGCHVILAKTHRIESEDAKWFIKLKHSHHPKLKPIEWDKMKCDHPLNVRGERFYFIAFDGKNIWAKKQGESEAKLYSQETIETGLEEP